MTVKPVSTGIIWGGYDTDIPGLSNCLSTSCLTDIQSSCTNTSTITAYGTSSTYPAAWAAKNYKPSGTPSGKSWCLPSGGLLNNALNNQTNLDKINTGITTAGGTILGNVSNGIEIVWSSSEGSSESARGFYATMNGTFTMTGTHKSTTSNFTSVRPVLEF